MKTAEQMGDVISRSALLEAMEKAFLATDPTSKEQLGYLRCLRLTREAPTVEGIEVTRCRDCANYRSSSFGHPTIGWCKMEGKHRRQNFYCADGERRGGRVDGQT